MKCKSSNRQKIRISVRHSFVDFNSDVCCSFGWSPESFLAADKLSKFCPLLLLLCKREDWLSERFSLYCRQNSQAKEGLPDLERRPSIDLAAGLNRSPRRAPGGHDVEADVDIRPGLFPHFRSATPTINPTAGGHLSYLKLCQKHEAVSKSGLCFWECEVQACRACSYAWNWIH